MSLHHDLGEIKPTTYLHLNNLPPLSLASTTTSCIPSMMALLAIYKPIIGFSPSIATIHSSPFTLVFTTLGIGIKSLQPIFNLITGIENGCELLSISNRPYTNFHKLKVLLGTIAETPTPTPLSIDFQIRP